MIQPPSRGFVLDVFPEVEQPFPLHFCPPAIQAIVETIAETFHAEPATVAISALAIAAAALGPNQVVTYNRSELSGSFNVLIAHTCPRMPEWHQLLQTRLLQRVVSLQRALAKHGVENTQRDITQRQRDLAIAEHSATTQPQVMDMLKLQIARLQARLQPEVIIGFPSSAEINAAVTRSFDQGLLVASLGTDAIDDLATLTSADRRKLASRLNTQWESPELPDGIYSGKLCVIWTTQVRALKKLSDWREFHSGSLPVPLLVFLTHSDDVAIPPEPLPGENEWNQLIDSAFDTRCLNTKRSYAFESDASEVFTAFRRNLTTHLSQIPDAFRTHVAWLPGLGPRLALLFHVLSGETNAVIPAKTSAQASAVASWLGGKHLQSLLAALPIRTVAADGVDDTDLTATEDVMLAKIRAKGPLTERQLRRCYNRPDPGQVAADILSLLAKGKLQKTTDGKLITAK